MARIARSSVAAVIGAAITVVLAASAHATTGVDCGCTSTGAYVDPALPDTAKVVVVPYTPDGASPHQKYYLQVNTSTNPYLATIFRHDTPTTWQAFVTVYLNPGSWWGFSPDDDRFLNVVPTTPGHEKVQVWNLPGIVVPQATVAPNYASPDRPSPFFTGFSPSGKQMVEAWIDFTNQATILIRDPATGVVKFSDTFTYDGNQTTNSPDKPRGVGAFGFSPDGGDRTLVYDWIDINGGTNAKVVNLEKSTATSPAARIAFAPSTNFTLDLLKFSPCGDMLAVTSLSTDALAQSTQIDLFKTIDGPPTPATGHNFNGWWTPLLLQATSTNQVATVNLVQEVLQPNTAGVACPQPLTLTAFTLASASVVGGASVNGTLTFSVAPAVDTPFSLGSVPAGAISGPASPTVPAHANPYTFPITTAVNMTPDDISADLTVTVSGSAPITQHVTISPTPRGLQELAFDGSPVLGGDPVVLHVVLNAPAAYAGTGEVVRFTNPRPDLLALPDTVLVAPGYSENYDAFFVPTHAVNYRDSVTITGTCGGVTRTAKLVLRPPGPRSVRFQQQCVAGGDTVDAWVELEAPAPSRGIEVGLSCSDACASPPASVVVQPGQTWGWFAIPTTQPPRHRYVSINATGGVDGAAAADSFEVHPGNGQYSLHALGTLPFTYPGLTDQTDYPEATGISPNGVVAGETWVYFESSGSESGVAMSWHGRAETAWGRNAWASDVNDAGVMVGGSMNGPWVLRSDNTSDINFTGTGIGADVAMAVNANGDAAGGNDAYPYYTNVSAWFRAAAGTLTFLPLNGGLSGCAMDVNDSRVVVGDIIDAAGAPQPFRWDPVGGMTMLPLPDGATGGSAMAVNNVGVICGWTQKNGHHQATAWIDGGTPTVSRVDPAVAAWEHINNLGWMVANVDSSGRPNWQIRNGDRVYNPVPSDPKGSDFECNVYDLSISGINDAGEMAVNGTNDYGEVERGYLLTSLPGAPWMDGGVPVLDAAAAIELLEPTRVKLRWAVSGLPPALAKVQRRVPGEDWTDIGTPGAERDAYTFEDAHLVPGRAYAYRLSVLEGGRTLYLGAVDVVTPHPTVLSVLGFFPNPSSGEDVSMAIVLPDAGHAEVELLDISGRRVYMHEFDAADPGTLRFGLGAHLPPGIYLARVSQGAKHATARLTVVR